MPRGLVLAVVVALLTITAGCSGVTDETPDRAPYSVDETVRSALESGSESKSAGDEGTNTEPVPAEYRRNGVTADGIVDGRAFFEAYRADIKTQSHTYHVEKRYVDDNGIVHGEITRLVQVDPDAAEVFVFERTESVQTQSAEPVSREYWIEEGVPLERVDPENGPVEYNVNRPQQVRTPSLWVVHALVAGNDSNTTVTERDDTIRIDGQTSDPLHPFRVDEPIDVRLTVASDGQFWEYELEGNTSRYDDLRYVERVRYVNVGGTTVDRPDWVETARAELESRSAGAQREGETTE